MVERRYAKALFTLAKEKGILDRVKDEVEKMENILKSDVVRMILSPAYPKSKKVQYIENISKNENFSNIFSNFLKVVVSKGRENILKEILLSFKEIYYNDKGIEFIKIISPKEEIPEEIKKAIERFTKKKVFFEIVVDETLIGGIEIIGKNWRISSSLKYFLEEISRNFKVFKELV